MKLAGKNALFHFRQCIDISSDLLIGLATGTAICLRALPLMKPLKIIFTPEMKEKITLQAKKSENDQDLQINS